MNTLYLVKTRRRWTFVYERDNRYWCARKGGMAYALRPEVAAEWAWADGGEPQNQYSTRRQTMESLVEDGYIVNNLKRLQTGVWQVDVQPAEADPAEGQDV